MSDERSREFISREAWLESESIFTGVPPDKVEEYYRNLPSKDVERYIRTGDRPIGVTVPAWWRDTHTNCGGDWTIVNESHIGPVVFCCCRMERSQTPADSGD